MECIIEKFPESRRAYRIASRDAKMAKRRRYIDNVKKLYDEGTVDFVERMKRLGSWRHGFDVDAAEGWIDRTEKASERYRQIACYDNSYDALKGAWETFFVMIDLKGVDEALYDVIRKVYDYAFYRGVMNYHKHHERIEKRIEAGEGLQEKHGKGEL